jgi:hypothetical protein
VNQGHPIFCLDDVASIPAPILQFKDLAGLSTNIVCNKRPVGFRLGREDHASNVMVKSVVEDGHAESLGVRPGWQLSRVNDIAVQTLGDTELDDLIHGPMCRPYLSLQSFLDVLDDFRTQLPILQCYFELEDSPREAKTRALAKVAAEVMKKADKQDEFFFSGGNKFEIRGTIVR